MQLGTHNLKMNLLYTQRQLRITYKYMFRQKNNIKEGLSDKDLCEIELTYHLIIIKT